MKLKIQFLIRPLLLALVGLSAATSSLAQTKQHAAPDPVKQLAAITTLLDSIPDIIFYKDLRGVYRGGNKAWTRLAGKPLDQLIGKTDTDLFPEEIAKSFQENDREMLASRQTRRAEEWAVYPDGRRILLDTVKTPWVDGGGKLLGVLGISREITPAPALDPKRPASH